MNSQSVFQKREQKSQYDRIWLILSLTIAIGFIFSNCSTNLAPKYDQAILNGINATTKEMMELFSSVAQGGSSSDFSKREQKYNSIIGSIQALKIQLNARPMPNNKMLKKIREKVNEALTKRGLKEISDEVPSLGALNEIEKNIINMRETDKAEGLKQLAVDAYKGGIVLYLDQFITYENFLKR